MPGMVEIQIGRSPSHPKGTTEVAAAWKIAPGVRAAGSNSLCDFLFFRFI